MNYTYGHEEKYLMISNGQQFCAIARCASQLVEDYIEYGRDLISKEDGSIDLQSLSEWLGKRKICHRVLFLKEENPKKHFLLQEGIDEVNRTAWKRNLFLTDKEVDALLSGMAEGDYQMSWNSTKKFKHL
jgi:hypothetical protein